MSEPAIGGRRIVRPITDAQVQNQLAQNDNAALKARQAKGRRGAPAEGKLKPQKAAPGLAALNTRSGGSKFDAFYHMLVKRLLFNKTAKISVLKRLESFARMRQPPSLALEQIFLQNSNEGRNPTNPVAYAARDWRRNYVDKSQPLGTAGSDWLSREEALLINAGAGTDRFVDSLKSCLFIIQNRGIVTKQLRKSLIGPILSIVAALVLPVVFNIYLVPALKQQPSFKFTSSELFIESVGSFVINDWPIVIGILASLIAAVIWSMPRWTGKLRIKFDKIPPWSFYRIIQGSNFMLTMAALTSAGIGMTDSMRKIAENKLSPYMKERVFQTLNKMEQGAKLGTGLDKAGFAFPDKNTVLSMKTFENDVEFTRILNDMALESITNNVEAIIKQAIIMSIMLSLFSGYIMISFTLAFQQVMVGAMSGAGM